MASRADYDQVSDQFKLEHTGLPEKLNVQSRGEKIKDNTEALRLSDWENGDTLSKMRKKSGVRRVHEGEEEGSGFHCILIHFKISAC